MVVPNIDPGSALLDPAHITISLAALDTVRVFPEVADTAPGKLVAPPV
jgi:hypothetical protein